MKIRFFLLITVATSVFANSPSDSFKKWCESRDIGVINFVSAIVTASKTSSCEAAFLKLVDTKKLFLGSNSRIQTELSLEPVVYFKELNELAVSGEYRLSNINTLGTLKNLTVLSLWVSSADTEENSKPFSQTVFSSIRLEGDNSVIQAISGRLSSGQPVENLSVSFRDELSPGLLGSLSSIQASELDLSANAGLISSFLTEFHPPQTMKKLSIRCSGSSDTRIDLSRINIKHLEDLSVSGCTTTSSDFLPELPSLRALTWAGSEFVDLGFLRNIDGLESLNLGSSKNLKDLSGLKKFKRLKNLNLGWTGISDDDLEVIGHITSLTSLDINNNPIKGHGLKYLAGLTGVTRLDLDETLIGDEGIEYFKYWPSTSKLAHLRLFQNKGDPLTGKTLQNLSHLTEISFLQICYNHIDDAGLEMLASGLPNLTTLVLRGNNYTNDGLRSISKLSKLKSLMLSDNKNITSAGLKYLTGLSSLEELAVYSTQLKKEDVEVVELGSSNKNVKILTKNPYWGINEDL